MDTREEIQESEHYKRIREAIGEGKKYKDLVAISGEIEPEKGLDTLLLAIKDSYLLDTYIAPALKVVAKDLDAPMEILLDAWKHRPEEE